MTKIGVILEKTVKQLEMHTLVEIKMISMIGRNIKPDDLLLKPTLQIAFSLFNSIIQTNELCPSLVFLLI